MEQLVRIVRNDPDGTAQVLLVRKVPVPVIAINAVAAVQPSKP